MKKILLLTIALNVCILANAFTYTFTGTGDWNHSWRWTNGLIPPVNTSDSIVINGIATKFTGLRFKGVLTIKTGASLTVHAGSFGGIYFSTGKINVETGGTLNCWDWVMELGGMQIDGTVWFTYVYDDAGPQPVIINGTVEGGQLFSLARPLIINNGGVLHIRQGCGFASLSTVTINTGGTLNNQGTVYGTPNIVTNNFVNSSILAPGNSPGLINITGNYSPTSTASHQFEIGGITAANFDKLQVTGNVAAQGALSVSLYNGYVPSGNFSLPIITGSAITGSFSSVTVPPGFSIVYSPTSVNLVYGSTLPVNFINVSAKSVNDKTLVSWTVSEEQSVDRYVVEKSMDGKNFKSIGIVQAQNKSQYEFLDKEVSPVSYYRIKNVDLDGKYGFSKIIEHKNVQNSRLKVLSMHGTSSVTVQHNSATEASFIDIYAMDGKMLKTVPLKKGSVQTQIDISTFASGVYILRVNNNFSSYETALFEKH